MLLYTDFSLECSNTFNIKSKSDFFVEIGSVADIDYIFNKRKYQNLPRLILGNGSNVLFTKNFKGIILHNAIKGVEVLMENDNSATVKVASGENFDDFCDFCAKYRYFGPEFLSGIPGQVGGAIVQNIGAYGQELSKICVEVEYYNFDSQSVATIPALDCNFGYRNSIFKNELKDKAFILSATFRLDKGIYNPDLSYANLKERLVDTPILTPTIIRRTVVAIRDSKIPNPKQFGNAGSFFKNPTVKPTVAEKLSETNPEIKQFPQPDGSIKLPAGQLIDLCGFKNLPDENVAVAPNNALIVMNLGNASGKEIVAFAKKIQSAVKKKFGVNIEPEVVII